MRCTVLSMATFGKLYCLFSSVMLCAESGLLKEQSFGDGRGERSEVQEAGSWSAEAAGFEAMGTPTVA